MADLAGLLSAAASDRPPPADSAVTVVDPPDPRSVGVFAFTAHHVISAPVDPGWVRSVLPAGDLSAPLNPPFLTALTARTGRVVNNIDAVFAAPAPTGPALDLRPVIDIEHARVARARAHRADVRVWTVPGGVLMLGRGVAGRWEVSVEVDPAARSRGLGRALFTSAAHLVPLGEPVWAQVAPGNAASIRAVLAAGFRPVGAEALLFAPHDPRLGAVSRAERGWAHRNGDLHPGRQPPAGPRSPATPPTGSPQRHLALGKSNVTSLSYPGRAGTR